MDTLAHYIMNKETKTSGTVLKCFSVFRFIWNTNTLIYLNLSVVIKLIICSKSSV